MSPIATDPPRRRWRRPLSALVALLVARELFPLPLDLFASRHDFGSIAMAQRRDRDGLRPSVDRAHPTSGFMGLLLFNVTLGGGAVPDKVSAEELDRAAGGFKDGDSDPGFASLIAMALDHTLQLRFMGDARLGDARFEVVVPFAARGGAAWVPLRKQLRAAVAVEVAVVPRSGPAVDFAGHVVRRSTLLGPCSRAGRASGKPPLSSRSSPTTRNGRSAASSPSSGAPGACASCDRRTDAGNNRRRHQSSAEHVGVLMRERIPPTTAHWGECAGIAGGSIPDQYAVSSRESGIPIRERIVGVR